MKTLLALALILWSAHASGSDPANTAGPLDCSTGICTSRLITEKIPFNSTAFRWTTLTQQFNHASVGENVATYTQQWKQGTSPSWAFVAETRCIEPRGGCDGSEFDLVVNGPLQPGDWRLGQSIVIWRLPGSTGTPTANYGLLIAPEWAQRENIRVDVGIGIQTHCNVACLQIRSGESIALDDAGQITLRYNPTTQQIEFRNGTRVLSAIPTQ